MSALQFYESGVRKYQNKAYQKALEDFNQAILLLKLSDGSYYYFRGKTYYKLGQYELALADLNRAIAMGQGIALYYYVRAKIHFNLKNDEATIADCQRALQDEQKQKYQNLLQAAKNRQQVSVLLSKAKQQTEAEDFIEAIESYTQVLQLNSSRADVYLDRSKLYLKLQRYDDVVTDLNSAIALQQDLAPFYYYRAYAYFRLKNDTAAITDCEQALVLEKESKNQAVYNTLLQAAKNRQQVSALLSRAKQQEKDQETGKAISTLTQVLQLNSPRADVYADRAKLYLGRESYALAVADYEQALQLDQGNSAYANQLAIAKAGLAPQAEKYYQQGREQLQQKKLEQGVGAFEPGAALDA